MYGSTKEFLNYFSLKSLDELPPLSELQDFDSLNVELDLLPPDDAQEIETENPDYSAADTMTREVLEQPTGDTSIVPALIANEMDSPRIKTDSDDETDDPRNPTGDTDTFKTLGDGELPDESESAG